MLLSLLFAISVADPDLRLELERESLTATHQRYRQYIDGLPVVDGEVLVTIRRDGTGDERRVLAATPAEPRMTTLRAAADLVWLNIGGAARLVRREVVERDGVPAIRYSDVESGAIVREDLLGFSSKPARVFDPNPVTKLNAPELRDQNDAAAAVPPSAYSDVELLDVRESGPLGGPWVQIADFQAPSVAPVDASSSLFFDRSESGFEDVNTYFHIDRTQRYLQTLGYFGRRTLVPYPVEADTHAAGGTDNSFFIASPTVAGRGRLHFGEGGTDDAEDSDLIVHEYAHAIHEWISPGTFLGSFSSQARAISEGFGDYLAFAAKYHAALASGRDPFCFADWDARCWTNSDGDGCAYRPGSDCLRRLDSRKTVADLLSSDTAGTEHRNGEIWSAALAEIFIELTQRYGVEVGRRVTDTIVIESLFGTAPHPSFATIARQMMAADRYVSGGRHADAICAAMTRRGILDDCVTVPRGELTYVPGRGSGVAVPDNDPGGVTLSAFVSDPRPIERLMVSVNIRHRGRGELRVALIAPDGTMVRLFEPSPERAPDLVTTFGRDSLPIESLDVFRGRSAAGEWRLRVVDTAFGDVGTVVSWSLVIQFAGQEPAVLRPAAAAANRQVVPVAGNTPGANETFFRTDLRLLSRAPHEAEALLIFTPSAADGRTEFAAVRVAMPPEQVVAFEDVVRALFATAGTGQLEIIGEVIASTRTWTPGERGTFGLFANAHRVDRAVPAGGRAHIGGLRNDDAFRTNLGFAEVSGVPALVQVQLNGPNPSRSFTVDVPAYSHVQLPASLREEVFLATIRVERGAVLSYGAVIDNRSGDPILIPAVRESQLPGSLIPAISAPGANGTRWRTQLTITSTDGVEGASELGYRQLGEPVIRRTVSGTFARLDDVVATLFERPNTIGSIATLSSPNIIVTARVWTEGVDGTYGQFIPFGEAAFSTMDILHVENSSAFRTNVGVLSPNPARVRVTLFDSAGTPLRTTELSLLPFELVQFPVVDPVVNGRLRVEVLSGGVYAYASLVDNGTGDPIFVPAQ